MAVRVSRRKLAEYYAEQLLAGSKTVTRQLAAYLIDTRRTNEAVLIVRDVEYALLHRGVAVTDVASSHPLGAQVTKEITAFIKQASQAETSVQLRTTVDPTLLGGIKIQLPGQEFDGTIRRKLTTLKARKV